MKTFICLLAILTTFAANAATAKALRVHAAPSRRHAAHRTFTHVRIRHARRRSNRVLYVARASDHGLMSSLGGHDDSPRGAGFIKDKSRAGWGWRGHKSETVLGVYRRPDDPSVPSTDMYHEGKGAAGVSMSIQLGH